jgi:hypothetical protein
MLQQDILLILLPTDPSSYGSNLKVSAKVLSYNEKDDAWDQVGQLIKVDNPENILGVNVKLSGNGNILAVSSYEYDDERVT